MTYHQTFHIDAPVTKVFGFFKDPGKWARQSQQAVEFKDVTLTREGVGTHYSWSAKIAGLRLEGFNVFTEFTPDRRIKDRSSSSLEGTWTYTVEPDGAGTTLTVENQVGALWRLPPLEKVLDRMTAKSHAPLFDRLKETLEKESRPS